MAKRKPTLSLASTASLMLVMRGGTACSATTYCAVHAGLQRSELTVVGRSKWFKRHVEPDVLCLSHQQQALQSKAPLGATKLVALLFRHFLRVFKDGRHLAQADERGQEGGATRRCVPGRS